MGKLKNEPMQPAALLSQAHILQWHPLILQGFLLSSHYCLSFAFVPDHYGSILRHLLPIFADSFGLTLPFPQGWSVCVES